MKCFQFSVTLIDIHTRYIEYMPGVDCHVRTVVKLYIAHNGQRYRYVVVTRNFKHVRYPSTRHRQYVVCNFIGLNFTRTCYYITTYVERIDIVYITIVYPNNTIG